MNTLSPSSVITLLLCLLACTQIQAIQRINVLLDDSNDSVITVQDSSADLGVEFNEQMNGYFDYGDLPYDQAYDSGEQKQQKVGYSLTVVVPHVEAWIADPNHPAPATGKIWVTGLTPEEGTPVLGNSSLYIFPGDVENYTLLMEYYLPFIGNDGQAYHLEGTKYIYGNHCIQIYSMFTTLYCQIREGHVYKSGEIVDTGITKISPAGVVELALSIAVVGEGTDAEKLTALVDWFKFLLEDTAADCLNSSAREYYFWYIWTSDGQNGFLLDLIVQPDQLELRLDLFSAEEGVNPSVLKQYLALDELTNSTTEIVMGPVTLTNSGCHGSVNNIPVDIDFRLNGRFMDFIPEWISSEYTFVPTFASQYGTVVNGGANDVNYTAGTPMVYSTYPVPVGMDIIKWVLISAVSFQGTDLQVEIMGSHIKGLWLASSYVYYNGKEHKLNQVELEQTKITKDGEIDGDVRTFAATINADVSQVHLEIECSAPVEKFALLENLGQTTIHTTVLGQCKATDVKNSHTFYSNNRSLLEVKDSFQ